MNLPCFFIGLQGLFYVLFSKEGKYRFIGFAYVLVIILLLISHGKNYYSLGAYPVLFAFGAVVLEKYTAKKRKIFRYGFISAGYYWPDLPANRIALFPPQQLADLYMQMHAEKTGALKWEDLQNHPLPQDFSDMLGWEEMAQKVAKAYASSAIEEKTEHGNFLR